MNWIRTRPLAVIVWAAGLAASFYAGMQFGVRDGGGDQMPDPAKPRIITNSPEGESSGPDGSGGGGLITGGKPGVPNEWSVKDLIARARAQVGAGNNMMYHSTGMMKAMAPLAELAVSEIREALAEVDAAAATPQQKSMLYAVLLGQLAETDGPGAMAWAEEHLSGQGAYAGGTVAAILGSWAETDPDAAWNWFLKRRGEELASGNYGQLSAIFSAFTLADVDAAFARLEQLDSRERSSAVYGIARGGAWDPERRERILAEGRALPDDARMALFRAVGYQWAATDPEGALEWIEGLSPEDRKPLVQQVGTTLMMSDPTRGADLMIENASGQSLPYTYSRVISQWAGRDPNAAGDWLNRQPQGPALDAARSTFARSVAYRDPESAMEWAKAVEDPNQQLQSVRQVYTQWKYRDRPAADAALDQSGLTAEQIEGIREKSIRQPAVRMGGGGTAIPVFR